MSAASKENVQLLRAVVKHPTLYDRGDENYRKRLASENSWDMVASEVGESVEKCKRRWRQLRNDYTRWCNADANRRRQGHRRFAYPLAEEVRFLDRHLNLTDANNDDEERSESEKDRDSNRDSESRDDNPQSVKGDAALDDKSVNEDSLVTQLPREEDSATKEVDKDKDKTKEKPKQKKAAQEKSVEKELEELEEPEKSPEQDSYLQSDQEGDEPIEEEHLEQLEDFDFEDEESLQELKKKESKEKNADSPAGQSEFFIKQNTKPHLLIIGKKNSTFSGGDHPEADDSSMGDPLEETTMEESTDETAVKSLRGRESTQSPSRRLRRLKEAPIKKPTQGQRLTRFQRRKSISMGVGQHVHSSTSPVKLAPVPRAVTATKSVQVKRVTELEDDIFPRPAVPPAEVRQNLRQTLSQRESPLVFPRRGAAGGQPGTQTTPPRRGVGRPPKRLEQMQRMQRLVGPQVRQQSPSTPNVLTISKPSSSAGNTPTGIANKGPNPTTNTAGKMTKIGHPTLKSAENRALNYSPSSSSSPTAGTTKISKASSPSVTMVTGVATSTATVSAISVPQHLTLMKRSDRTTQTECQDIFSDEHFLEMIRPQMKEMNARQKMHFKKKVFNALMETFDDATDFPEAGELQHFNINTPSGFEHVTNPELRLIRELVSMVSAAKVSSRGQPQPQVQPQAQPPAQAQPKEGVCYTAVQGSNILRGTRGLNIPGHLIQRVYKHGPGVDIAANNAAGPGAEKKMYRFLQTTNGKPNGGSISASLEDLRKDSVDSDHSLVRSANLPPASPKAATIVAAVRPQGSSINTFFGHPNSVPSVKTGPSLKARALARRYSICSNGNQAANGLPINQAPPNASSLNSNLSPMEAAALKRRLLGPGQPMVPPSQRPRFSVGPGGQQISTPQGNSLLVRKSTGSSPGIQKQLSPPNGGAAASTSQKTPQITNVQGGAFKDFAQPKPAASSAASSAASPGSTGSSTSGEGSSSQSTALKRSLVVANAKGSSLLAEKHANKTQQHHPQKSRLSSMTAATIAADDFSLEGLKHEPMDHVGDQDDILGM